MSWTINSATTVYRLAFLEKLLFSSSPSPSSRPIEWCKTNVISLRSAILKLLCRWRRFHFSFEWRRYLFDNKKEKRKRKEKAPLWRLNLWLCYKANPSGGRSSNSFRWRTARGHSSNWCKMYRRQCSAGLIRSWARLSRGRGFEDETRSRWTNAFDVMLGQNYEMELPRNSRRAAE